MKKLSIADINRISDNSIATLKMEGLVPSPAAEDLGKKYLAGVITEKEAKAAILKHYNLISA